MKTIVIIVFICLAGQVSAQKQGICGKVLWLEGNQMPGPGPARPKAKGVVREIHIYEVATLQDANRENGFYKEIKTDLVAKTFSESDGSYKVKLPPGRYSVFTKEPEGLFANLFDQTGAINPVTVETGKFTTHDLSVNYKAAY
jgi:hypothetical protein